MLPRLTADQRREQILEAGVGLFASKGFEGTTTADLARAAGVSEALIFRHFPHKESLYAAILERKIEEMDATLPLRELKAMKAPLREVLVRIARAILTRSEQDSTFLRLFLRSALDGHPMAADFDRARAAGLRTVLATHLRRHAARGHALRLEPPVAARAFLGLVAWFAISRTILHEPGSKAVPRDRLIEDLVTLFLDGVAERAGSALR